MLSYYIHVIVSVLAMFVICAESSRTKRAEGKFHGSGPDIDIRFAASRCDSLEQESLSRILGPAYNPRYMSVIPPSHHDHDSSDVKRNSVYNQFSVDVDYSQVLDDIPAWEVDHFKSVEVLGGREKRSVTVTRPWECESAIKWIDLGSDYFPRYLRSVECTKHDCWYGKFTCKPRSFTVKLLRRKKGKCVYHNSKTEGTVGLPKELRELWVWEERAVNFCCDCAPA